MYFWCGCVLYHSDVAVKFGYGVVEHFVGHGVGRVFHSAPSIVHARKFIPLF
jgi:methionyl aminopeptidase